MLTSVEQFQRQFTIKSLLNESHVTRLQTIPAKNSEFLIFANEIVDLYQNFCLRKLCSECGKSFLASYLRRHYQRVHLKEKRFECDICGLRTFKKQHIEEHLKRHFKIKDYHCDQCPSAFTTGTELKIHIKNVHCEERPFKCDHKGCDSAFKQKENLKEHMLRHTQKKNFVCVVCDKGLLKITND